MLENVQTVQWSTSESIGGASVRNMLYQAQSLHRDTTRRRGSGHAITLLLTLVLRGGGGRGKEAERDSEEVTR